MLCKIFIFTIILFEYISIWYNCNGVTIVIGRAPNVTGLTPNASVSEKISLYGSDVNLKLSVYQRPVNDTMKETLRVLDGSTNIDFTGRCIYSGTFPRFWGQYPVKDNQNNGNGGCDAILGRQCSESIHSALQQYFSGIIGTICDAVIPDTLFKPLAGCPSINFTLNNMTNFIVNKTFTHIDPSLLSLSTTWMYEQSDPSVTGDYDEVTKYFFFTYFVGRTYTTSSIDTGIACLSIYNNTNAVPGNQITTPQPSGIGTQLHTSGNILIFFAIFTILFNMIS